MNLTLARIVSVLAHPVFVNLACLLSLFAFFPPLNHGLPERIQLFYISFIFISTSIIPLVFVLIMRVTGKTSSLTLNKKEERNLPYLLTISLYIFNYYNFEKSLTAPSIILNYLLACTFILLLVFLVNYYSKISIHLATLGALFGIFCAISNYIQLDLRIVLILIILISGLTASARISLNAHTPIQVYTGFLLGFVCMFSILTQTIL